MGYAVVVICPKCGMELDEPERWIENSVFRIELYSCERCGTSFKNIT